MNKPIIKVNALSKVFNTQQNTTFQALKNVTFEVDEHDFISIIGPSGCGKSTILRMLSGLEDITSGQIELSESLSKEGFGFVFQDSVLFPWKTVRENVAFPLEIKGDPDGKGQERVDHLLGIVGLDKFADSYPRELSGGMRQRASIARSLSYDPNILLMDEPFGALDALTRDSLNVELHNIWSTTRKTILFVTHDIDEAVFLSTKVIVLSGSPTTVRRIVPIELGTRRELSIRSDPRFRSYADELREMLE